jgi:hypothetical protein
MGLRIIIDHQLIEDDRFRYAQPILQESAEVQLMVVLVGQTAPILGVEDYHRLPIN